MKNELRGRIMKDFVELRPKICSYLSDDGCFGKKSKWHNRSA